VGSVAREVWIGAPIDRVFDVIADYARYPEFVPGVKGCRPLPASGGIRHVEYEVDLGIRRVRYVLALREQRPTRIEWSLLSGEFFSRSDGSWELSPERGGTRARYALDVQVNRPPLVPKMVVDRVVEELTRVQLPLILEAFRARAERVA
jgi:coenzyme Q-binding protein COQ10